MSITAQAQHTIDIYELREPRNGSAGASRHYVWTAQANVMWQWDEGDTDEGHKQQRPRRYGVILTEEPDVFAALTDAVMFDGTLFGVDKRQDVRGRVYWVSVSELLTNDPIGFEAAGGGRLGGAASAV